MRNDDRQKHIGFKLRFRCLEHWEHVEALDWNQVGFNFHSAHSIAETQLEFKRGLIRFDGSIVWRSVNTDPEVVRTAVVNELLYQKAREAAHNPQLHARLVKLIRADGLQVEKRKALTTLGMNMSDERLDAMVHKRQRENPMYRYGVKVESEAWSAIVHAAREVTSVVDSMEKWSGALGKQDR